MMSQAWRRDRLAEFCSDTGIDHAGSYFLQNLIRLADPSGVLDDNALSTRTASLTVPWAMSVLGAHRDGHLYEIHARRALKSALSACDSLSIVYGSLPTVSTWAADLSAMQGQSNLKSSGPLNIGPSEVASHQGEVASFILSGTAGLGLANELIMLLAAEVAVGLISRNADMDNFIWQVQRLDSKAPNFRETLIELLLRPEVSFNVLVPVEGALNFDSIELLDSSAGIRQVTRGSFRAFTGWGSAAPKASEFTREYETNRINRHSINPVFKNTRTFISATMNASDVRAAAIKARQKVAEVLDQYVVGHPSVQFDIDEIVGVNLSGKTWVQAISVRPPTEDTVKPLAIPWPPTLRQAMRVAHLLRDAVTPMTRIAIAWVMIESSNLKKGDIDSISRTLSLTLMRQSIFMPYRFLVQDSIDRGRGRFYEKHASYLRKSVRRSMRPSKTNVPPDVMQKRQAIATRTALLADLYLLLEAKSEAIASRRRELISQFDAEINPTMADAMAHKGYLPDMSRWLNFLSSDWATAATAEAIAIRELLTVVSDPVTSSIESLSQVTKSGAMAAAKLRQDCEWIADVLWAFYAARNMNLHSGIFNSNGDVALAELAILIADSLFETWGTWYSNGSGLGLSAIEVIRELANRYDRCVSFLESGGSLPEIDPYNTTAPTWHPKPGV